MQGYHPIPDRAMHNPSILSSPMTSDEFLEMKAKVRVLEAQMLENTALTKKSIGIAEETRDSTRELVEFSRKVSGTIDILTIVAKVFKPIAWLGIVAGTVYGMGGIIKMWVLTVVERGIK